MEPQIARVGRANEVNSIMGPARATATAATTTLTTTKTATCRPAIVKMLE